MADDRRLTFAAEAALRWAWFRGTWEEHLRGQCEAAADTYGLDPDVVYDKALGIAFSLDLENRGGTRAS